MVSKRSPYLLPDGNVQIAFSGGRTSGYMLYQLLEANGGIPDRARVIFNNTGRERNETLDFVQECSDRWGIHIDWIEWQPDGFEIVSHNSASRNGEPFERLVRAKGFLPNRVSRFCTIEMKGRSSRNFLTSLGWEHWTCAVGIRADEPKRLGKPQPRERWTVWHPLAAANVSKHDVVSWWDRQPFDLRLPVINGVSALGNCDGCFLKSEATLAMLARDEPERFKWWESMEDLAGSLNATSSGAQFRYGQTYHSLRDFIERQGDWLLSDEAFLCQASDGECTE